MYITSGAAQHLLRTRLHTARMTELSNSIVATSVGKFLTYLILDFDASKKYNIIHKAIFFFFSIFVKLLEKRKLI